MTIWWGKLTNAQHCDFEWLLLSAPLHHALTSSHNACHWNVQLVHRHQGISAFLGEVYNTMCRLNCRKVKGGAGIFYVRVYTVRAPTEIIVTSLIFTTGTESSPIQASVVQ